MLRGAALASAALITVAFRPPEPTPFRDFDKRAQPAVGIERKNAAAELRILSPEASVHFDPVTHSAAHVTTSRGFLSGPAGQGGAIGNAALNAFPKNDPHRATKAFLKQHRELFGHGPEALESATVQRDFVTAHNGLHTVVWEQRIDNIPVFEGVLVSHTTAKGELVSIGSHFASDASRAHHIALPKRNGQLTAAQAVQRAALSFELQLALNDIALLEQQAFAEQKHRFNIMAVGKDLIGETTAELTLLPMSKDELRLCWNVVLKIRSRGEVFRLLVDTQTGEVILRRCLTAYVTNSTFNVFTSDSPSPFSPSLTTPGTNQPPLVSRTLVIFTALNTNASPAGWIDDAVNETRGNNADAHLDRDDNDAADLPRPQGSPYHVFDFPLDLTQSPLLYGDAAVVQLFYWCNFMHDKLYEVGFTEAAGNFQVNNFGRGGLGNDAVLADAQDGGGFNNANMSTFGDGVPPRMQMYLFNGPNPDRDGDYDAEIVLHEYTHGLSNRRVGGGVGISALQSEGMGEGWSDFYALSLLSEPTDDVNATYAMGGYATYQFFGLTQNYYYGIRRYPYSTDMSKNPLTFRDIDPTQASFHSGVPISPVFGGGAPDEVHNQGEVWCVTLWELRANLITKYGWTNGNKLALQLVTDGMNLSPANPTFLQARDAIIQADLIDNSGVNRIDLWAAFAKRGMGASATSPASSTTVGLHEAFDLPDDLSVTPNDGFTASGPFGGPFSPTMKSYTLRNGGSNAIGWTVFKTANWLDVSLPGGTLATGATTTVNVSLNSGATLLTTGIYSGTVRFTNTTSGVGQARTFTLRVAQPDYFTELFNGNFDLSYTTITFTPDGSPSFYSVCRDTATNFPTSPAGGNLVSLSDDSYQRIFLSGTNQFSLYGTHSSAVEIVSNGYLTINGNDTSWAESVSTHFNFPRISALFRDLYPPGGGTISWQQLSNRFVVTYDSVPEYVAHDTNTFQIEWFFDGRIRITYLQIDARSCLVGLSEGLGIPFGFEESDYNNYGSCAIPVAIAPIAAVTEGSGTVTNGGRVILPFPLATNVTVSLASSDISELTVPASVVILAGATNGFFDLNVIDDAQLDGTQIAIITAIAPGFSPASRSVSVNDNESATLTVSAPATATEGGADLQAVVNVSAPVGTNVVVWLASIDASELIVPPFAIIPAGQTSTVFTLTFPEESQIDGAQTATITASVTNWISGQASITVLDNESLNLVVTFLQGAEAYENSGTLTNFGVVEVLGLTSTNLPVSLSSSDPKLVVPNSVIIPAGQNLAFFSGTLIDNGIVDGTHFAVVSASAGGFITGSNTLTVLDDESPPPPANPSPANLAANVIATSDLSWTAGTNTTNDVYFGTNPVPGPAEFLGTTTGTSWPLPLLSPATTYYWQVVSHRIGATASPVWQFTTRGLHHFAMSSIAGTQYVGLPFAITITAKDEFESTVSNFTGAAQLAGQNGSGEVLRENFDAGLGGFALDNNYNRGHGLWHLTTSRGNQLGHSPFTSLYFGQGEGTNGGGSYDNGFPTEGLATSPLLNLTSVLPPVKLTFNQLIQTELGTNWDRTIVEVSTNNGASYEIAAARFFITNGWTSDSGGLWLTQAVDLTSFASSTARIRFHFDSIDAAANNYEGWFIDDVVVGGSAFPILITPLVSGAFVNGSWSGNVTVLAPGTNVFIVADDGSGHKGTTGSFVVIGAPRVSLTLIGTNAVVTWPSLPGRSYRVETKASLEGAWNNAGPDVLTLGTSGTFTNGVTPSRRFYQLRLLP